MENKSNQKYLFIGLPILAVLVFFLTTLYQKVYPGVFVCNQNLAGKNLKQAEAILSSFLPDFLPEKIILVNGEKKFFLKPEIFTYSPVDTAKNAFSAGRNNLSLLRPKELWSFITKGKKISFSLNIDEKQLEEQFSLIAKIIYSPASNPQIKIVRNASGKKIVIEIGKEGQELDIQTLKQNLLAVLSCPQKTISLSLPILKISPQISSQSAEVIRKKAELFLNKEIMLKLDNQSWTVGDEELISLFSFNGGFDKNKILKYSQTFAENTNTSPEDATFVFEENVVKVFKPSKEGFSVKEKELADFLEKKLVALENTQKNQIIDLPVIKILPKISTKDTNSLGIKELIGKGSSLFFGSIPERIHNVNLAASKLNGILLAPNEEFSFNKKLGDVSEKTGFKQAYIIKGGRTVLGDGGGVCQVSTTLFRAALNTGLPITERHAHAYRVHYYEDDAGPGMDATVFDPSADLKFKNNTPSYLLIQSKINLKSKKLDFEIYGTSDKRKAEISKVRVWDQLPPPPDLYQDDPTLPFGVIKQIDWKAWGAKAAFDYKVTRENEVLENKTFTSNYKPWQAIYLKGTLR